MTTSFERFQERNKKRAQSTRRNNASFLIKGYNSTIITRDGVEVAAAVVNEQEKGVGYIYTALDKSLSIGDV